MKAQSDKTINMIRGKNIVSQATSEDMLILLEHIDALEFFLDEYGNDDVFGTQGWRYAIGLED